MQSILILNYLLGIQEKKNEKRKEKKLFPDMQLKSFVQTFLLQKHETFDDFLPFFFHHISKNFILIFYLFIFSREEKKVNNLYFIK